MFLGRRPEPSLQTLLMQKSCCKGPRSPEGKDPHPQDFSLSKKRPVLLRTNFVLLRSQNGLTQDVFVVNCTGGGGVVKRPGVLSKVLRLDLVLGVGVSSPLPTRSWEQFRTPTRAFSFAIVRDPFAIAGSTLCTPTLEACNARKGRNAIP